MHGDISIFLAFSAGILSFFSPCVLPLIPSYITFLLGDYTQKIDNGNIKKSNNSKRLKLLLPGLIFIFGFSLVFILLGLSASFIGKIFLQNQSIFRRIGGIIVIILGLHVSGIINIKLLYRQKGFKMPEGINKFLRALVMGMALAFAWTPCVGPILSSILVYAGTSQNILRGGILLAIYSSGFALPFILTALFIDWFLPKLKKINPYLPLIEKISGGLIILIGILILTNNLVFYQ